MTTLRERRKQMLRDEILDATQLLIGEKGYAAMSMDELAVHVGVSKPTLYNQFPTKDDLVVAVVLRMMESIFVVLDEDTSRTPLEQLAYILHSSVQSQLQGGTVVMQLWMPEMFQLLRSHPDSLAVMKRLDDEVNRLIYAAAEQGEFAPHLHPAVLSHVFHAMVCTPTTSLFRGTDMIEPQAFADTVAAVFLQGVRNPEALSQALHHKKTENV